MAAGLGTRMRSDTVKVLHEIAGKPLVAWVVDSARTGGVLKTVVVTGHQADDVAALLSARYSDGVHSVIQEQQRGTADAVRSALPALADEPDDSVVVILTGDAPLFGADRIQSLVAACESSESGCALVSTRAPRYMPYGRLLRDDAGALLRIVEEADASEAERALTELNAGFYAVRLGHLRADLENLSNDNEQGEFYLTDLAAAAHARGGAAVLDVPWDEVSGINDRYDLACVEAAARALINRKHMAAGVSMAAPDQVFIDADTVEIEQDVWLGPGVHLRGKVRIGKGARIDAGSVLTDTEVGPGTLVKPYSVFSETKVGPAAQIGPFSHCRPGTVVDEGAKLGNFVETKKAHLMAGAKANHLAYLGDVSIGSKANIGAGTITCNYDGFNKYKTVIEAGAFIGSDSQLVAPVTVGKGAYVGFGYHRDQGRSAGRSRALAGQADQQR